MSLIEGSLKRVRDDLNDILECSVCKDAFVDPRMLPCIHSFCLNCLKSWVRDITPSPEISSTCREDVITCPICRSESPMPENGVEGLHKNFFLTRLKETVRIVNSTSDTTSSCDICRRDSATAEQPPNAEMYCSDCKERLCSKCCSSHIINKPNRKHTLIAISDSPDDKVELEHSTLILCDVHKQNPINLYCLKCREVLCAMCYVEKHLNHEQTKTTDASQMFRDQIQESIARLSPDKDILLKKKGELEHGKSAMLLQMAQLEKRIIDIRDAIVKRADDDAKSLLHTLTVKKKEKEKDVEMSMSEVVFKYSCLDGYLSYCNELSREGSDIDICREAHLLETRSNELTQSTAVSQLSSEVRFQMEFKKTDIDTFLAQSNVIGKLYEVQDCNKLQKFEESEHSTEVKDVYVVKMKPQRSDTFQPHVQDANSKDTGSANY